MRRLAACTCYSCCYTMLCMCSAGCAQAACSVWLLAGPMTTRIELRQYTDASLGVLGIMSALRYQPTTPADGFPVCRVQGGLEGGEVKVRTPADSTRNIPPAWYCSCTLRSYAGIQNDDVLPSGERVPELAERPKRVFDGERKEPNVPPTGGVINRFHREPSESVTAARVTGRRSRKMEYS